MDHAGSAADLADLWDAPIYVHPLEIPFVTGRQYPPGDPTIGGFLALLGRFFRPRRSIWAIECGRWSQAGSRSV
jgi:glyoxylase-like metal-dependent hydrolase (beta-lactamase superfamily II)